MAQIPAAARGQDTKCSSGAGGRRARQWQGRSEWDGANKAVVSTAAVSTRSAAAVSEVAACGTESHGGEWGGARGTAGARGRQFFLFS